MENRILLSVTGAVLGGIFSWRHRRSASQERKLIIELLKERQLDRIEKPNNDSVTVANVDSSSEINTTITTMLDHNSKREFGSLIESICRLQKLVAVQANSATDSENDDELVDAINQLVELR